MGQPGLPVTGHQHCHRWDQDHVGGRVTPGLPVRSMAPGAAPARPREADPRLTSRPQDRWPQGCPERPYRPGTAEPCSPVSYTHLRAHETRHDLVCRLLLEKKNTKSTLT